MTVAVWPKKARVYLQYIIKSIALRYSVSTRLYAGIVLGSHVLFYVELDYL